MPLAILVAALILDLSFPNLVYVYLYSAWLFRSVTLRHVQSFKALIEIRPARNFDFCICFCGICALILSQ